MSVVHHFYRIKISHEFEFYSVGTGDKLWPRLRRLWRWYQFPGNSDTGMWNIVLLPNQEELDLQINPAFSMEENSALSDANLSRGDKLWWKLETRVDEKIKSNHLFGHTHSIHK